MSNQGIYLIINNESGKVYVGSTVNFKERWAHHKSALRHNKHYNLYFQRAWNKYGEAAFEFMVCEYIEDKEQLYIREQYWLDFHRLLTDVYNMEPCVQSPMYGKHHTEKHKRYISEMNSGENNPMYGKHHTKEALRKIGESGGRSYPSFIHLGTNEIIPAGRNLAKMCRKRNLHYGHMQEIIKGIRGHCMGWVLLEKTQRKACKCGAKPYPSFIHKETGEVIPSGFNLTILCRERGLAQSCMNRVKRGELNQHKGWVLL